MSIRVFFSWQNDTPTREGRNLIEKALRTAVANIAKDVTVEEAVRGGLEVDKDTQGVPGSPPLFDTILTKIRQAAVFVPDFTFVTTRSSDRPTPNPNVLIEYGYALKAVGHSGIIAVMNEAYGGPGSLPFDLAHHRFPIRYNLPDGAPDAARQVEREKLAKQLETALRLIFESEEFRAKLPKPPEPPPFPRKEPMNRHARFRPPGQPLGVGDPVAAELLGLSAKEGIYLSEGPAMWLRLMPTSDPGKAWLIRDLQEKALALAPLPLMSPSTGSFGFVRGQDGGGYYPGTGGNKTPAVAYVFVTGEVWLINTWPLRSGLIPLEEERFTKSLEDCATFLDRLGAPRPYSWIVGIEGVQNYSLSIPSRSDRTFGPCLTDVVEKEGTYKKDDNAAELLRPFFEKIFDQCGTRRP
ncbi:MAG: hypothetical protein ACHP7P_06895 [Terriglobales bacterium]